jgi:hypothetical protein
VLLNVLNESVEVYTGTQSTFQKVDELSNPIFVHREVQPWFVGWLKKLAHKQKVPFFLACEGHARESLLEELDGHRLRPHFVFAQNKTVPINLICSQIREILQGEAQSTVKKSLSEFRITDKTNQISKNVFQIAKAAIIGKVKKLVVADGISIFGKLNRKTGDLSIHPFDLDHEDDDILDDLAQAVLASGGDVIIAPLTMIPDERPLLAILDEAPDSSKRILKTIKKRTPILTEREANL